MKNIILGLILIILGVIIGLNTFGITSIDIFFDGWWTLFIIIPAILGLSKEKDKTGNIIGAKAVNKDNEVLLITTEGIIIRISVEGTALLGRVTSGVKLMNLDEGVTVASMAKVREDKSIIENQNEEESAEEESSEENKEVSEEVQKEE